MTHYSQWRTKVHVPLVVAGNSICLRLLGALPQTPTGALPLDPARDFRSPDPLFCPLLLLLSLLWNAARKEAFALWV